LPTEETQPQALEAIVLAAGMGARFGGGKLLAPWGTGVVLDGALAAALAAPVRRVVVVTGHEAERVEAAVRAFSRDPRIRLQRAADYAEGMAASLRCGIAALGPEADGAFVFLADMPRVPADVAPALAAALANGAVAATPLFDGRRGHPVLFGRTLFAELLALRGEAGAREVLARHAAHVAFIRAQDDGVLFDVDAPDDLPQA